MTDRTPTPVPSLSHRPKPARFCLALALGVAVTAGVARFAVREFDWQAAWATVSRAQPGYLALSLAAMLLNIALKMVRWAWLLHPPTPAGLERGSNAAKRRVRRHGLCLRGDSLRLLLALLVGQLGNVLLPTRLGDVARVAVVCRGPRVTVSVALVTIVAEKALDGVLLLAILALLLPFIPLPPWLGRAPLALSASLALLLGALLVLAAQERLHAYVLAHLQRCRLGMAQRLATTAAEALEALRSVATWRAQGRLWGITVSIWLLSGAVNHFGFRAVGLSLPFTAGTALAVTEIVGTRAAYAPAAVGVYHSICLLTLALFGVPAQAALSAAILLHLIVYLPILIGGLLSVWLTGLIPRGV